MKKTSLAKRNALLLSGNLSWGAVAFAFAVMALFLRLVAPNLFWQAFAPVFQVSDTVAAKSHSFLTSFSDAAAMAAQNEKLATENATLANQNAALLQKVANLSALIGDSSVSKSAPSILAGIVARPPESPYDTLMLAAGEKEGVLLGMEAFGDGGVPIGVVSMVQSDFSRVTLFSSPGTLTSGSVGHTNLPLTLTGAGAGTLNASAARAADVAVGDTVFVPGPGMLPIGSVVRIDSDPLSPGVTLRIKPAVNPFTLAWVQLRATGALPTTFATSTP
ncbi:MAG: rod shape-determining protein MreC [Minisyncoccota bacterium]